MAFLVFAVTVFGFSGLSLASHEIGHTTMTFIDASRYNRVVSAEVYYPSDQADENVPIAAGQFPLLVFSHGWQTSSPAHNPYWKGLVPEGYVMALPRGNYTFYFALDDPDGVPTGPWLGLDAVTVDVR